MRDDDDDCGEYCCTLLIFRAILWGAMKPDVDGRTVHASVADKAAEKLARCMMDVLNRIDVVAKKLGTMVRIYVTPNSDSSYCGASEGEEGCR